MVYTPTGSTAKDREMSTHTYDPSGHDTIYLIMIMMMMMIIIIII